MKRKIFRLPGDILKRLKDLKGIRVFDHDEDISPIEKDPDSTIIIVGGHASVLKNNAEFIEINPGYALNLDDLHLRAKKNLQAIFLDAKDFREDSPVGLLFKSFFETGLSARA